MRVDLAVIIVTWNVRELALQALRTLYDDLAESGLSHVVYVVDSASSDGTAEAVREQFPQVRCIASPDNLGFAGGNNAALRALGFDEDGAACVPPEALPRAVYLLNPDTITQMGATRTLFDVLFAGDGVGLVGANLTYGDGSFQHGAFAFPGLRQIYAEFFPLPGRFIEGRFNGRYPRRMYDGERPFTVDFTLGATMMLRREVVQSVGLLDEDFFMYAEEVDWGWRVHKAGYIAQCVPTAHVVHLGGQSTGQVNAKSVVYLWESRLRLYAKHYPVWKQWVARWLVRWGMQRKLRQLAHADMDDEQREAVAAAYRQVIAMAGST